MEICASMTRRLLALARDSRFALAATILSGFLAGLLTIGQAAALSRVIERVFLGGQILAGCGGAAQADPADRPAAGRAGLGQ